MANHAGTDGTDFRVGRVIARGVTIYFSNIVPFLIISAVAYLPLIVIAAVLAVSAAFGETVAVGPDWQALAISAALGVFVLLVAAYVLAVFWLMAGITHGVIAAMRQGHIDLREVLAQSLRSVVPLVGLAALAFVFFLLASLLNFIPLLGTVVFLFLLFYFAARWWVVVPAIVVEGLGPIAGLRRSSALTGGNR